MNEEINDAAAEEKKPLSIEELEEIYETKTMDAANNASEILRRRLAGEKVEKEETENHELIMKDLSRLEKTIKMLKKQRQLKNQDEIPGADSGLLKKVQTKEGSVSAIVRKII